MYIVNTGCVGSTDLVAVVHTKSTVYIIWIHHMMAAVVHIMFLFVCVFFSNDYMPVQYVSCFIIITENNVL